MTLKYGDKVRVTACETGHQYQIGDIVQYTGTDDCMSCLFTGDSGDWYMESCDFQAIESPEYSIQHYDTFYKLTEEDIKVGEIKVDAYWVAKQWKTGSKDDSGALWHSLKTIARFGEKNTVEREIKALYNQAKALARIYKVDLE